MTQSVKLALEYLQNSAANQVLANTTFALLDQLVQAGAVDKDLSTPPGSPANGALYIVASSPTGAWSGKAGQLAFWLTSVNAWSFIVPKEGFLVHVNDEDDFYKFNGSSWEVFSGGGSGGGIASIVAGTGIAVDATDPDNPIISATGSGGMSNPMTSAGDIIVGGSSGTPNRLGIGSALQRLRVNAAGNGLEWSDAQPVVLTESTTSRTLALTDAGKYLRFTNSSAKTCTVPPQSSVAWPADTEIHVRNGALSNVTLSPGSGVTLNAPYAGTLVVPPQGTVTLKRVASDVWDVMGVTV